MRASSLRLFLFIFAVLLASGCTGRGGSDTAVSGVGAHYTVIPGDTLLMISARYDISEYDIARANHLQMHDGVLVPGQDVFLPGVSDMTPVQAIPEPPQAVAATAEGDTTDQGWYVPRSVWAVESIDKTNIVPMTHIYRITVHHSGEEGDVEGDPSVMMRHFEHIHKSVRGWACIAYHFVIAQDGTVYEGRPIQYQGAHAVGDNNIGNIGICLIGDFDRIQVPQAQKNALITTLDRLREQYGIDRTEVFGHRHFKATDCPGRYLFTIVENYRGTPETSMLAHGHHHAPE